MLIINKIYKKKPRETLVSPEIFILVISFSILYATVFINIFVKTKSKVIYNCGTPEMKWYIFGEFLPQIFQARSLVRQLIICLGEKKKEFRSINPFNS